MSHEGHHHPHSPDGPAAPPGAPSFERKLAAILEHWKRHNEEHARTYRDWAENAGNHQMPDAARGLAQAAEMTAALNRRLDEILERLKAGGR